MLGDHVGRLSRHRDACSPERPRDGEPFPACPRLLIEQLSVAADQIAAVWSAADPDALGDGVSWAGAAPAPAWLDAARDFSEYWTHHHQICDAIGQPGLTGPDYLGPVLDTFMRALPHTLRHATAPEGAVLQMVVTGPGGGSWTCTRAPDRWRLRREPHLRPTARVELDPDTAWRLCTRGIPPGDAAGRARVDGDRQLGAAALQIVSIIWSPPGSDT